MGVHKDMLIRQGPSRFAHSHDPATSKASASVIAKSGKLSDELAAIYDALKRYPMHTARELSVASGIDYFLIQKRLSVLERMGYAVRHTPRICTKSGTGLKAVPWEAR